jgi:ArsR family transcriptional regulator
MMFRHIDVCQWMWQTRPMALGPPAVLEECCSPLVGQVITPSEAETIAATLKAVADPVRLRLISLVAAHADAEACVCDLTDPVGLSQPTVSHHLKVLVDAGILTRDQRGRWAYYRLVPDALASIGRLFLAA